MTSPHGAHGRLFHWGVDHLQAVGNHRFIHDFLVNHGVMRERNLELICLVAGLYSIKLYVEGIGLWFEKQWAKYLTIIATSCFLPFSCWELVRHHTGVRWCVFLANVLIVLYLVSRLRPKGANQ